MLNIVVFASGNGTTLQSIIDAIKENKLDANIKLVISDNKEAYALERAQKENIETYIIKSKTNKEIDIELTNYLIDYEIDLIVLAGYLKIIGENLIENYTIINTHPSLLPKFGGKNMYGLNVHQAVIDAKEKESGVTLHYVNNEYDKGQIIAQTKVEVTEEDTKETLAQKVQEKEKIQLIEELQKFSNKKQKQHVKNM